MCYLSELLHLYSPSQSLRSSSDTRMLKIHRFNCKTHGLCTFSHFGLHIWNNLPHQALCYSLFLQKPTHFSSQNISVKPHCPSLLSVCTVCVCVCVHLLHSYAWTLFLFIYNIFHLDVHYVCMLVQRFEPQGRRFTNFHYYYYSLSLSLTYTHTHREPVNVREPWIKFIHTHRKKKKKKKKPSKINDVQDQILIYACN